MFRFIGKRVVLGMILLAGFALSMGPAPCAPKAERPRPTDTAVYSPDASVFGASLTEWLGAYWRWAITGDTSAPYQPGPTPLVFMPMPAGEQTSGSWTADDPAVMVGELHVTLRPGTPFVLPFFAWTAERYEGYPGVPDDQFIPAATVEDTVIDPMVTLDGRPVLGDFWEYYVGPSLLDPPAMYGEPTDYGSVGVIGFQGTGAIFKPLPPGRHVLHLAEQLYLTQEEHPTLPVGVTLGVIYDNTWIIDVVPPGKANGKARVR